MSRLVIVDDSLMIRALLREILGDAGHEVVGEAADGLAAERTVRDTRPEVAILDLVMPRRGGLETLPGLLAIDASLAVVVCSASLDQRRVLHAIQMGAVGFIIKPFNRESVITSLDEALRRAPERSYAPNPTREPKPALGDLPGHSVARNRRDYERLPIAMTIRIKPYDADPFITETLDLSAGGASLATGPLLVGQIVNFCLALGFGQPPIEGRARVARRDSEGHPALAFEHVTLADHQRLNAVLRDRRAAATAP